MDYDFDTLYNRRGTDSNKWHRFGEGVLPFWVAEMDFRAPEQVRRALAERVAHGFFGYGYTWEEFHEVFRARLKERYGWDVPRAWVVPIPGVIPGFNVAVRALTGSRTSTAPAGGATQNILVQLPAYPPILNCHEHHGVGRVDALLRPGGDGRYGVDWASFEDAIDAGTRLFLLCNPHNPVGRVFTRDELARMAAICLARDVWIVSDEIHCDIVFSGSEHVPIASLSPEIAQRTITFMAPSKAFNLAGLKASVAIIPTEELRASFEAARAGLVQTPNILGYLAMTVAYRDGGPWLEAVTQYLEANRDLLARFVDAELPGVRMTPMEGTYLAWLDFRATELPQDRIQEWLLEHAKVALGNGADFGAPGRGYGRFNFACPRPMLEEGLDRMATAMRDVS
ncbi:MAG: MalY/PatB family protein [Dehalococcoidia bacterium]